ncbi:heme ABC transporter ATP-binding protein [Dyadobacter sp. LJ53]|uniref:heme ABC transporter ATP-binding protein n=1 Tax=Dyadobacter chenwenxiniae TaxID=2906456 RepID=UPI001F21A564|nr:heme ABC transporter ATP-binding protein [Dyadobacter chenwenxiniae]MCF0051295.1 heme ABC transporter ATP-binding protein [Dyadobacter chenwenxiniae]
MIEIMNVGFEVRKKALLKDISFNVSPGQFWAVVGANGAGKSTLIKILSAELSPTSGSVFLNGKDLKKHKLRDLARKRAVLSQQNVISLSFTVQEIVLMGRYPFYEAEPAQKDLEIVEVCLKKVGISALKNQPYPTLSGGEQQRVQLARALAQIWETENGLLLLDEPTTGMDLLHQFETFHLAKELAAKGFSIVAVVHDLNQALQYADQVLMLKNGQGYAVGSPEEVLNERIIKDVFGLPVKIVQSENLSYPVIVPDVPMVSMDY